MTSLLLYALFPRVKRKELTSFTIKFQSFKNAPKLGCIFPTNTQKQADHTGRDNSLADTLANFSSTELLIFPYSGQISECEAKLHCLRHLICEIRQHSQELSTYCKKTLPLLQ